MKKHKRLLIILSIIFIVATIVLIIPKKGSYADFGDFSSGSDYGSSSCDDSDIGIFFLIIEILSLFVDLADLIILIIDYPQFSLPIIHLLLVIICLIKIHRRCEKDKKSKYMILSIFIPLIAIFAFPKAKPNKYKPISTYVPQDSHITHITAHNNEKQKDENLTNQDKSDPDQPSPDKNNPSQPNSSA